MFKSGKVLLVQGEAEGFSSSCDPSVLLIKLLRKEEIDALNGTMPKESPPPTDGWSQSLERNLKKSSGHRASSPSMIDPGLEPPELRQSISVV